MSEIDPVLQEARDGVIDLVDDDPHIVGRMLNYLYNPACYVSIEDWLESDSGSIFDEATRRQKLIIPHEIREKNIDGLVVHAKMHGLSKKYDIPGLRKLSCERFVEFVADQVETDPSYTKWRQNASELIEAIKIVYGSEQESDRILQEAAVYLARMYAKSVADHHKNPRMLQNIQAFRDVVDSLENFAWDMIVVNFEKARFVCDNCEGEDLVLNIPQKNFSCKCAARGLCGQCTLKSKIHCHKCGEKNGFRLISWEKRETISGSGSELGSEEND